MKNSGQRIVCGICGSSIVKSEIKRHMNTHTKLQKYFCNKCDHSTSTKTNLKTHINSVHLEAKHLHLSNNITCKTLPQYLQQGFHPKRSLQEILQ